MSQPLQDRRTPPLSSSSVTPGALSPAELADVLAVAGSAEVRAAYACGLASALLPVLAIVAQEPELSRLHRMGYVTAGAFVSLALVCGLITFLDALALKVVAIIGGISRLTWHPVRDALFRAARGAVQRRERERRVSGETTPGLVERLLARAERPREEAQPLSQRARRALTKSVASQCAATLAVLGGALACFTWMMG